MNKLESSSCAKTLQDIIKSVLVKLNANSTLQGFIINLEIFNQLLNSYRVTCRLVTTHLVTILVTSPMIQLTGRHLPT